MRPLRLSTQPEIKRQSIRLIRELQRQLSGTGKNVIVGGKAMGSKNETPRIFAESISRT
jgi:hypothetical protein